MARKRKKLQHLDYQSREYWNRLLAEESMSMSQGENPKLVYAGTIFDLAIIEKYEGKVNSEGKGPDD